MDIASFVYCAQNLPADISVLVRGPHGIGKSKIIFQLAKYFKLRVIDKRLSQLSEGDMVGLPELINGVTRFAHPDWYIEACEGPVVLFFDEFNRALPEVMQAAFQIILDRELNGKKLHPGTRVFACINNDSRYQINDMDPALLDRFWTCDLEPTVEDWLAWASKPKTEDGGGIHKYLIDFVRAHTTAIDPSTKANPGDVESSRRSFERGDTVCQTLGFYDAELGGPKCPISQQMFQLWMGFVGSNVANQIVSFIKNIERQISAKDILDNWSKVEDKIEGLGQEKWNICIEKIVAYGRDNVFTKKQATNIGRFVTKLPGELVVHFWQSLVTEPNDKTQANIKIVHPFMMPIILGVFGKDAAPAKE